MGKHKTGKTKHSDASRAATIREQAGSERLKQAKRDAEAAAAAKPPTTTT